MSTIFFLSLLKYSVELCATLSQRASYIFDIYTAYILFYTKGKFEVIFGYMYNIYLQRAKKKMSESAVSVRRWVLST